MSKENKYCWLDINTGKFSDSWGDDMQKHLDEADYMKAVKDGYKLIKYTCVNDPSFELYKAMKIVSNTSNLPTP